ncbi:MAG: asparaginyl/glutamyl-tRNA amidotransferase subunit C [Elusimicrobia bacterium RIFOXYA1_FULL_47_7]|nr:MAG: asparaginyl/glutamyl-tRNA amidotransferase subunit C [Elusimicrobia bacterium RIFOXYA12_FULL_49_49]OGS08778.1 MAG: asparaginyl/glutamyl-tRNA amidotransferase subunit C [Elusimicrobia bacterium RIFOXYA1_FULL_47_7]OGS09540.1 MAG: asparaginyl/glutamyl-tRNA amidotransferase subunit C [Elusimicrobia bacterium RIFOXYB1_FULL_48_9]OGS16474.1 MAG: asparaginyl/glutamyl-tRNA amidotransferase subunit C [Elusimicrobia bacterium RIFOXYA2_FULL_47_53]OGS26021.1 MAG: asparaginyl/glutamyl-tRNA amidotrans
MKITNKEVDYAARLARLELSAEEKEKYSAQLESILKYIDKLNELDTSGVKPTSHVMDIVNVWRKDISARSSEELVENILANAPERSGNFYKVKKIIE